MLITILKLLLVFVIIYGIIKNIKLILIIGLILFIFLMIQGNDISTLLNTTNFL